MGLESLGRSGFRPNIPALANTLASLERFGQQKKEQERLETERAEEETRKAKPLNLRHVPAFFGFTDKELSKQFAGPMRDGTVTPDFQTTQGQYESILNVAKDTREGLSAFVEPILQKEKGILAQKRAEITKIRDKNPNDPKLPELMKNYQFRADQLVLKTSKRDEAYRAFDIESREAGGVAQQSLARDLLSTAVSPQGFTNEQIQRLVQSGGIPQDIQDKFIVGDQVPEGLRSQFFAELSRRSNDPAIRTVASEFIASRETQAEQKRARETADKKEPKALTRKQTADILGAKRDDAVKEISKQLGVQTTLGFVIDEANALRNQQATVFLDDFIQNNSAQTAGVLAVIKATVGAEKFDEVVAVINNLRSQGQSDKEISTQLKLAAEVIGIEPDQVEFLMRAK